MNKLSTIARVTEVDDASDQLVTLYEKTTEVSNDAFLKGVFDEMRALSNQITEAIRRDKAESDLAEADTVRDEKIRQLSNIITGYASMPIETLANSGLALKGVFDRYGVEIAKENYASESSLIESLLLDFSADGLRNDVEALQGVPETLAALRSAQDAFNQARLSYDEAKSHDRATTSASEIKRRLLNCINGKMVAYLSAMAMSAPATYGELARLADEEIARINAIVSSRGKKAGKKTEDSNS